MNNKDVSWQLILSNVRISARRQNWQNSGELEQFKAMDTLISRCLVRQRPQRKPGVRAREKRRSRSYTVSSFHILIFLLILPTKFLRTSSASHRTPMGPSHTRGRPEISEPLRNERRWHSDLYSVWGNAKFVSTMYKHTPMPPFCYRTVYIHV